MFLTIKKLDIHVWKMAEFGQLLNFLDTSTAFFAACDHILSALWMCPFKN